MKYSIQILLLLFLLVIPTKMAFACVNSIANLKSEKSSCTNKDHEGKKMACCDSAPKEKKDCDGSCNNSSCQSAGFSTVFMDFSSFDFVIYSKIFELKNQWIFKQISPQLLSISIWQPPKIG